eukprot:3347785-Amphidinium_carterae.2
MRHLGRTHRVSAAWLHEIFLSDNMVLNKCDTNDQAADIFTESFTDELKWRRACSLIHFGRSVKDPVAVLSESRYRRCLLLALAFRSGFVSDHLGFHLGKKKTKEPLEERHHQDSHFIDRGGHTIPMQIVKFEYYPEKVLQMMWPSPGSSPFSEDIKQNQPDQYRKNLDLFRRACFFVKHIYAFLQSTAYAPLDVIFNWQSGVGTMVDREDRVH